MDFEVNVGGFVILLEEKDKMAPFFLEGMKNAMFGIPGMKEWEGPMVTGIVALTFEQVSDNIIDDMNDRVSDVEKVAKEYMVVRHG